LYFIGLNANELSFSKNSKVDFTITINEIITIRIVSEVDHPLPIENTCSLLLSTFIKQYTIIFYNADVRDDWIKLIHLQLQIHKDICTISFMNRSSFHAISISNNNDNNDNDIIINNSSNNNNNNSDINSNEHIVNNVVQTLFSHLPSKLYLSYSEDWILNDRTLLNTRNYTSNGFYYQLSNSSLELGNLSSTIMRRVCLSSGLMMMMMMVTMIILMMMMMI
jgi:hypothetical protein